MLTIQFSPNNKFIVMNAIFCESFPRNLSRSLLWLCPEHHDTTHHLFMIAYLLFIAPPTEQLGALFTRIFSPSRGCYLLHTIFIPRCHVCVCVRVAWRTAHDFQRKSTIIHHSCTSHLYLRNFIRFAVYSQLNSSHRKWK